MFPDSVNTLEIWGKSYNKRIIDNLPVTITELHIIQLNFELENLPPTVKKIVLSHSGLQYLKLIKKIPFGTKIYNHLNSDLTNEILQV